MTKPTRLAVAAAFRWEWPWLIEWLRYHLFLGVDHFYLYANEQGEDFERSCSALAPWVARGVVTLIQAPGRGKQLSSFNDAVRRARKHTRYLALIDLDEFLLPLQSDSLIDTLDEIDDFDTLAVNWACFGSGGLLTRPASQIDGFLWRAPDDFSVNWHVKLIVRPEKASTFHTPHHCDAHTRDETGRTVVGPFNNLVPEKLRINHYVVRSHEDFWKVKAVRGRPDNPNNDRNAEFFRMHDRNDVFDDEISRRFSAKVKASMAAMCEGGPPASPGTASGSVACESASSHPSIGTIPALSRRSFANRIRTGG